MFGRWVEEEYSATYKDLIFDEILNELGRRVPPARRRLLDVGAGAGTITVDLAGIVAEVTATEIGPEALELTRSTAAALSAGRTSAATSSMPSVS